MDKSEEWDAFIDALYLRAVKSFEASKTFEYQKGRQAHIDEVLESNLAPGEKTIIEEILWDLQGDMEYKMGLLYRQGFSDCIWLLKKLCVLT